MIFFRFIQMRLKCLFECVGFWGGKLEKLMVGKLWKWWINGSIGIALFLENNGIQFCTLANLKFLPLGGTKIRNLFYLKCRREMKNLNCISSNFFQQIFCNSYKNLIKNFISFTKCRFPHNSNTLVFNFFYHFLNWKVACIAVIWRKREKNNNGNLWKKLNGKFLTKKTRKLWNYDDNFYFPKLMYKRNLMN
jgi:hypothetical protein